MRQALRLALMLALFVPAFALLGAFAADHGEHTACANTMLRCVGRMALTSLELL
jgi:hypothetical protein